MGCPHTAVVAHAFGTKDVNDPALMDLDEALEMIATYGMRFTLIPSMGIPFLIYAAALNTIAPEVMQGLIDSDEDTLRENRNPYSDYLYSWKVVLIDLYRTAQGITVDNLLTEISNPESALWDNVSIHPGDAVGLASHSPDIVSDVFKPSNATEAAGLLALILLSPHVESVPNAVKFIDWIKPYLDTPEVSRVLHELPARTYNQVNAAEEEYYDPKTADEFNDSNFRLSDDFDEIGLAVYATLLGMDWLLPTPQWYFTPQTMEALIKSDVTNLLPQRFIDLAEHTCFKHSRDPEDFPATMDRIFGDIPAMQREVALSLKKSSPHIPVADILSAYQ